MNKKEFISELETRIKKYPDYQEILDYSNEVIQDKIDMNYLTEQEAVASLGSLDEICRNIEEQRAQVKSDEIVEVKRAINEENVKKEEPKEETKRVSGGKRFVYVLWIIATVVMCIASISLLVASIAFLVETIVIMAGSATMITVSTNIAMFIFGVGLFLFGMAIVAIHFSKVLVKFIFQHRPRWNKNVRKGLVGE